MARSFPYTRVVHRLTAIVLGVALLSTWSHVSALHIHAYTDHDHPEHRHGLADHEHATESHAPADRPRFEACSPSRHSISFVFVWAAPQQAHTVDAEFLAPAVPTPVVGLPSAIDITDIRVHGPPPGTQSSPRAPPLIFPT